MNKQIIPSAESKSADLIAQNLEHLKQIFPEVIKEGKVDFEALKDLLGNYTDTVEERFYLNWAGKSNARREAQKRSTGTLRPCPEESVDWDNTENLYIEGDNLEVLKLLQKSYHNRVKMIYVDPPYNTGKDFVYKDNYKDNMQNYLELTGQDKKLSTNTESDGRYHSNWLNMMYPRLKLARNLLTDDGVIFISIGVEEFANLKKTMDEIFGESNFIEIFSWVKTSTPPALSTKSRKTNEYILCYEKNWNSFQYNGELLDGGDQPLLNSGNSVRELLFPKERVYFNPQKFPDGKYIPHIIDRVELLDTINIVNGYSTSDFRLRGEFKWTQDFLKEEIDQGTTFIIKTEKMSIRFLRNEEGYKRPTNFIKKKYTTPVIDKKNNGVATNENASSELSSLMGSEVFSYPKPVSLLIHLINFIASDNDLILDFFSGSATTAEGVLQWVNREKKRLKYIMVQLPENLDENLKTADSNSKKIIQNGIDLLNIINKPHYITELAKERIRRAGKKIVEEQKEKTEKEGDLFVEEPKKLDIGFKVFKLDSSNINSWDSNPENLETALQNSLFNIKDDRSEDDLLYEILIKYGIELTEKINRHSIDGKTVYEMGAGSLIVCLADNLTTDVAEGIGKLFEEVSPEGVDINCRVVFKDSGFNGSDEVKTNTMLILKQHGILNVTSV